MLSVTDSAATYTAMAECDKDNDRDINELVLDLPGYDKTNNTVNKINGFKKSFPVYDDDVYLLTYPKSGMLNVIFINIQCVFETCCHWLSITINFVIGEDFYVYAMHLQDPTLFCKIHNYPGICFFFSI